MLRRQNSEARGLIAAADFANDHRGKKHRSRLLKGLGLRKIVNNRFVLSVSYLLSFVVVYAYFQIRYEPRAAPDPDLGQWAAFEAENGSPGEPAAPHEPQRTFERFMYRADAVVLPGAPYKHVEKHLDLRASQLVYLDGVRQKLRQTKKTSDNTPPIFDFHWADWVDMADLEPLVIEKPNCFVAGVLGSNVRTEWHDCIDAKPKGKHPDGLQFYFDRAASRPESEFRLALRAKTYLHSVAPIPKKLVFVVGEAAFVVKTRSKVSVLESGMVSDYVQVRLQDHSDISLTEEHIREQPISADAVVDLICDELERDLRVPSTPAAQYADVAAHDFDTLLKKIKKAKQASQAARAGAAHFHDAYVQGANADFVAPYDWRFFQHTLDQQRHRAALHYTVRAWLAMTNNLGITSWMDEDSLIGWAFNGLAAPWEKTVNFKMSSKDLAKLGTYNHSLIVDDPLEGFGAYLLDLSPHFMERARLNDASKAPDAADARFVDIRTGVYITINGLMQSDATLPPDLAAEFAGRPRSEFFNSGDGKFYHQSDVLPVKKTLFEGKVANVPGNALKLAHHANHDAMNDGVYDSYKYQDHLRLWIGSSKCNYVPQEDISIFEKGGSSFIGACHDLNIWAEYNRTAAVTKFRHKETTASAQLHVGVKDQFAPFYPDYCVLDRIETLNKEYNYPLPV